MNISFWYECGEIAEIGTGHKFRANSIGQIARSRGHKVTMEGNSDSISEDANVVVIDHINPPEHIICMSKDMGAKIVIIDGNHGSADVTVSAFFNKAATFTGPKYMAFKTNDTNLKYNSGSLSDNVFVGLGGFDSNMHILQVIKSISDCGMKAVIAKSINYTKDIVDMSDCSFFVGDNYYDYMAKCSIAITNGGLTMFQALYFGIPTIAIPQYDHQLNNIREVSDCCVLSKPNENDLVKNIKYLLEDKNVRDRLSTKSKQIIDGNGAARICDVIEKICK